MKRLLAIDYGLKRIGLAISDPLKITARPLKTISNDDNLESEILKLFKEFEIEFIILGKPLPSENNKELLEKIDNFQSKLKSISNSNVVFWDESFSSKNAFKKMIESGKKKNFRKEKGNLDAFAAAEILTDYINSN
jgi:putative Holliday junction resolvase